MRILIIALLACLLFPFIRRLIAGLFKGVFWLLLVVAVLVVIGTMSR
jgi:hypothetical protein